MLCVVAVVVARRTSTVVVLKYVRTLVHGDKIPSRRNIVTAIVHSKLDYRNKGDSVKGETYTLYKVYTLS